MASLNEVIEWIEGIYQLETDDPVLGGADGIDNLQAKQLANRTRWLKQEIEAAQTGLATHINAADPHPGYWNDLRGNAKIAAAISGLVNSSPQTLDTLSELANALGNDPNFATTISNALGLKASKADIQSLACATSAAGGTADALTSSYTPAITSLTNGMRLFTRANTANTTTTPTFSPAVGTIAAKQIVKGAGSALVAGDIAGNGHWLELQYDSVLDKWVLLNPASGVTNSTVSPTVASADLNAKASATGTNANITVSADEFVVGDGAGGYKTLRNLALTIAGTAVGVNGLDAGVLAASTWYGLYFIAKPDGTKGGILSLSATPALPAGYTYYGLLTYIKTDATNKYPLSFTYADGMWEYKVAAGSNVTSLPLMASGASGSPTTPTFTAVSVSAFVPPAATKIDVIARVGSANTATVVAPNNAYGAANASNQPPITLTVSSTGISQSSSRVMNLESSNIYYASTDGSYGALWCAGWGGAL